jgi:hypothetical protein
MTPLLVTLPTSTRSTLTDRKTNTGNSMILNDFDWARKRRWKAPILPATPAEGDHRTISIVLLGNAGEEPGQAAAPRPPVYSRQRNAVICSWKMTTEQGPANDR